MTTKPPPLLKPTVQRFYGMERARQVGLPTPDQVKYETTLQAYLAALGLSLPAGMASVASPPTSASTVYLMLGLHLIMTPSAPRASVTVTGNVSNSANNGETDLQLYYGTGAAPANGAAVTGTAIGSMIRFESATGGSQSPFSKTVVVTGLVPGTAYWFDLAMKVVTGTGGVNNVDIVAQGLN